MNKLTGITMGLLAVVMMTACQLSAAPPTPTPTLFVPTQTPLIITATSLPVTITPPPATATPRSSGNTTTCYVRTDWQVYIVQPGDTLLSIAARTNTTVTALSVGNCLTSADVIYAGQSLRVPVLLPPTLTPVRATATPQIVPTVTPAPPTQTAIPFPTAFSPKPIYPTSSAYSSSR
ncbi:MAG: LysM peptidoglycan-binding domain-containing protein [Chloroflexota bacterium]|nr:LysM peptidoglycan-binding domain-containing protein [Chloroflexota bacterium]